MGKVLFNCRHCGVAVTEPRTPVHAGHARQHYCNARCRCAYLQQQYVRRLKEKET